MGNQIYRKSNFRIYSEYGVYIVHNTEKPFKEGHTHIHRFNTAKYIIKLAKKKELPKHLSYYLWESLKRLSTDPCFIRKIECIQEEMKGGNNDEDSKERKNSSTK